MTKGRKEAAGAAGSHGRPDATGIQDVRASGTGHEQAPVPDGAVAEGAPVAVRTSSGWRVGAEEVPDLTSAMVLADLLAADLPTEAMQAVGQSPAAGPAPAGKRRKSAAEPADPQRLRQTVAQLEHALSARVRVEQAIGVLAERHRIRPRQAFELLRSVARSRGRRVLEIATEVVDSATNPLLRIPDELAKQPTARRRGRGRVPRHTLDPG